MVRFATGRMQNFRAATMWGGQRDLNCGYNGMKYVGGVFLG